MRYVLTGVIVVICLAAAVVVTGMLLPKAHVATRTVHLKQAPERIWALVAGDQSWRPELKKSERLPDQEGRRRWREVDRHGGAITFETVEAEPPRRLVTRIADRNLPFGGNWIYEIRPESGGAAVQITERGEVYNPIFRFVSRFIMGHTATIDAYLSGLRKRLEEEAPRQD